MEETTHAHRIRIISRRFFPLPPGMGWIFFAALFFCLLYFSSAVAAPLRKEVALQAAADLIGPRDALLLIDGRGKSLLSIHAHRQLVPASVLKIVTALTAFHHLGPGYRFETKIFLDSDRNLTVKGYGDPMLVSEVVARIACGIAQRLGPSRRKIHDLVLDDRYFADPLVIPGVASSFEPYDAPNGALCVNFNTVNFKRTDGTYVSAEPQTPLLPMVLHRIRKSNLPAGRIILSREKNEPLLYAGHLFAYFLEQEGIEITGSIKSGRASADGNTPFFVFRSPFTVRELVGELLEFSNNFMANQLLIAAGASAMGPPGTLAKGVATGESFARQELGIRNLKMAEGSGISRENRISAEGLLKALDRFAPYRDLMNRDGRVLFKTGTLHGIRTRVGYIENDPAPPGRFVILINTPGKSVERVMKSLIKGFDGKAAMPEISRD
jgi:serine-type D-Ala-D-Ala carboxypeptidase/endopeptidase (penicillin-binding protein 4)